MKQTVTEFQFVEAFRLCGRETQFSVRARYALFDHLEDYEDSCGVELELDPIGICCDWAEYKSAKEAADQFRKSFDCEPEALEWLREQTQVVEFDGGVVVQMF
jgi:hypothetical protein